MQPELRTWALYICRRGGGQGWWSDAGSPRPAYLADIVFPACQDQDDIDGVHALLHHAIQPVEGALLRQDAHVLEVLLRILRHVARPGGPPDELEVGVVSG